MSIMDIIRKMGERKKITKEKFREAQENMKIEKMLEERQKSANQRELERYMREQKEAQIKKELNLIHNKQNKENWKGTNLLKGSNILKTDRPILKEKNIFIDNKSDIPFVNGGGMFFK